MDSQRLDDSDSAVFYSGSDWSLNTDAPASYNNTITSTSAMGATAKLVFQGISVEVYGYISQEGDGVPPISSYTIDNGAAAIYTANQQATNQSWVLFYTSGQLSPGKHTLVVTNQVNNGTLSLDSFLLTPLPQQPVSPGAIVGATLGSLAFVLLFILAFVYWKQLKRPGKESAPRGLKVRPGSPDVDAEKPLSPAWPVITPFDLNSQHPRSVNNADGLRAERPLLHNPSGESLAVSTTSSHGTSFRPNHRSRSPSPSLPLPTHHIPGLPTHEQQPPLSLTTMTPPPSPKSSPPPSFPPPFGADSINDDIELDDMPPPKYVGSGLTPVRKSQAGMYALGGGREGPTRLEYSSAWAPPQ